MSNETEALLPEENTEQSAIIDSLRAELELAKDGKLRALAELENFRNRTNRTLHDERKYASIELMRQLLPVWDNMRRALEAAEKSHEIAPLISGVQMIADQFMDTLDKFGCKRIDALNTPFDPHIHESIAQQPSDDFAPNTVMFETQVGFKLHERVVRPSQVVLAVPVPK